MPLLDADGSTLGLVNAANVDSPPVTTYTYDPAGNPTVSGTANDWPFLYQGMEKEYTDPGTYYYSGGGQFYSPQLVRSLSETSATSTSGSNSGPAGNAIARPSGSGGVPTAVGDAGIAAAASSASNLALTGILAVLEPKIFAAAWAAGAIPGIIATAAFGLFDIFDAIFGGGDSAPPTPRQLLHGRHPLYPVILGITDGEIPTMESSGGPQFCGDPAPCPNARPLQKEQPKLSCQQQYIVDMADCSKNAEAKVGLLGGAAELACGIGAYFTDGADLLVCGGRVATMTATASVSVLAKCQIAAQAKEFECIESQTEP